MLLNLNRSVIELPKWSEAGACALRGDAGGSGLPQAGEEMALGHLTSACNIYKEVIKKTAPGSFCRCTDRERDKWSNGQIVKERMF